MGVCVPRRSVWGISFAEQNLNLLEKSFLCTRVTFLLFSFISEFGTFFQFSPLSRVLTSRTCTVDLL